MRNKILLKLNIKIKIKTGGEIFKYFIFLTASYAYLQNISFLKACKILKNANIYESMYLSNYFHDLQTDIFINKIFDFKTAKKQDFKIMMDSFWTLLEIDNWFKYNKAIKLFSNKQKSFTAMWNKHILSYLEQHKEVLKKCKKVYGYDMPTANILINKIVYKKN